MEILKELVIIMLVSVGVVGLTQIFRIPSVVGFILSGILMGPGVLGLVKTAHHIETLSEVGVMLLMFTIGLEFSFKKMLSLKKEVLGAGGLQVLFTIVVFWLLLSVFFNVDKPVALLISFVVSMSSTALVLKSLKEQGKIQTPHGRTMSGILIFQDMAVVPFMIITPLLAHNSLNVQFIARNLFIAFSGIGIIFLLSKFIIPRFFNLIYKIRLEEIFFIIVLSSCFGLSFATSSLGFSLSLGAFMAGMILADSDFVFQIDSEIHSLKNLFLSLFFISVGLLLDVNYLIHHPKEVAEFLLLIIGVKSLIITMILMFLKYPANFSLLIGLGLSQIGEFSFILLNLGLNLNIIDAEFYQNLLSASVVSMMATPGFLYVGNKILHRDALKKDIRHKEEKTGHIIIGGFGISGQNIARILKNLQISYVVVEFNPQTVKKFRIDGEPIIFGDITNRKNMIQLGADKSSMLLLALSDWDATLRAVRTARSLNPQMKIVVRTEYVKQIEPLYQAGADIVISQEFESSLEMAYHVMRFVGIPDFVSRFNTRQLRQKHYAFFNEDAPVGMPIRISDISNYRVGMDVFLIPRHASEQAYILNEILSEHPEIKVLSVLRHDVVLDTIRLPFEFRPCDLIVLAGPSLELEKLFENLKRSFQS